MEEILALLEQFDDKDDCDDVKQIYIEPSQLELKLKQNLLRKLIVFEVKQTVYL